MKNVKPIRPDEVVEKLSAAIPQEVIEAINELIVLNWSGSRAQFNRNEILEQINRFRKQDTVAFSNFPTNFEHIYINAGWKVRRESPDITENFVTYWIFEKKA